MQFSSRKRNEKRNRLPPCYFICMTEKIGKSFTSVCCEINYSYNIKKIFLFIEKKLWCALGKVLGDNYG